MGMVIFSPTGPRPPVFALLLASLHDLLALFGPASRVAVARHHQRSGYEAVRPFSRAATHAFDNASWRATATVTGAAQNHQFTQKTLVKPPEPSRLRVVRAFDPGVAPSCAGRMVISGRMADVCAELDRMTQKEAST